ncbi:MAG: hypothetical protein ACI4NM_08335 [Bullifex sp.]
MLLYVNLKLVEELYANESKLMDAVAKGKMHIVTQAVSSVLNAGAPKRLNDSLRDRRNYRIIFNTILRKDAEAGGLYPYRIHSISSQYAKKDRKHSHGT